MMQPHPQLPKSSMIDKHPSILVRSMSDKEKNVYNHAPRSQIDLSQLNPSAQNSILGGNTVAIVPQSTIIQLPSANMKVEVEVLGHIFRQENALINGTSQHQRHQSAPNGNTYQRSKFGGAKNARCNYYKRLSLSMTGLQSKLACLSLDNLFNFI
jgi:hypothetical protein